MGGYLSDDAAQTLAKEVESRYRNELRTKFPYADCYKLQRIRPDLTAGLIPDLDMYLGFIAGYNSSATTLSERSQEELRKAIPKLTKSFFDTYPEYRPLERIIVPAEFDALSRRLHVADALRRDLVVLMERLV
jgi:YxiJ-like protein